MKLFHVLKSENDWNVMRNGVRMMLKIRNEFVVWWSKCDGWLCVIRVSGIKENGEKSDLVLSVCVFLSFFLSNLGEWVR